MQIYKTTNLLNNKIYIGKQSKSRPRYLGSGIKLKRAIRKYGRENFKKEIIECCESLDQLNAREKFWIKHFDSRNDSVGYNLAEGGDGGDTFSSLSKERQEIRKKQLSTGAKKWVKNGGGKILSEKLKERWLDEAYREKVSSSLRGREIKWKDKISNSIKKWHKDNPRIVSDETRKKLSEAASGREIVQIPKEIKKKIIELSKEMGSTKISRIVGFSPYLVRKTIKKYKK